MFNQFNFDSLSSQPQAKGYNAICQNSSRPIFVTNQNWKRPFTIVIGGNILLILIVILLMRVCLTSKQTKFYLIIGQLIIWNIAYLFTQFLNPGFEFPSQQNTIKSYGHSQSTRYCNDCDAYIQGQSHHCGWFQKCIGKNNKIPFWIFLITTFGIFFSTMYTIISCQQPKH